MMFLIEGKLVPKQSTRFTKKGFAFTPKRVVEYTKLVKEAFKKEYPNHNPEDYADIPLRVKLTFYREVPKSFSKKKREQALDFEIKPMAKPDLDNSAKVILDSLNGLAYPDDRQVVELILEKLYASEDYTVCQIETCLQ